MKKKLSIVWIISILLVLVIAAVCVLAFASRGDMKGVYTDPNGLTWKFTGSKLKIDDTIKVDGVDHTVTTVFSYETETVVDAKTGAETEQLTLVVKKYKYSGDVDAVKQKVKEMNAYNDLLTETAKTQVYTVRRDTTNGAYVEISKTGTTIKLTIQ